MATNDHLSNQAESGRAPGEPVPVVPVVPQPSEVAPATPPAVEELIPTVLPAEGIPDVLPAPIIVQPVSPRPPHPNFWWSLPWCLGFLIVTQLSGVLAALTYVIIELVREGGLQTLEQLQSSETAMESEVILQSLKPAFIVTETIVILTSLLVIRWVVGADWKRLLALRLPSFQHFALALLGFPALVILSNGVYALAKAYLPDLGEALGLGKANMDTMVQLFNEWDWWLAVLVIGLGPGIGEELWCRGFLGRGLVGTYGAVTGITLTSFLFGLIHVEPRQALAVIPMGLALHFVYLMSRSLWLPMLLHSLNNSLAVVASKVPGLEELDNVVEKSPGLLYIASGLLLLAVAWALYQSRAYLALRGTPDKMPWRPSFPGVEHPPPNSDTVVVRPWPNGLASGLVATAVVVLAMSFYLTQTL